MKTLIASALIATATLTGAANAQAVNAGPQAAIAHFNLDKDSTNNRVTLAGVFAGETVVSSRSGVVGEVFDHFNADYDTQADMRGAYDATLVSSTTAYGSDIFAQIRAASAEDE